jgi:proteic killer suppression protein
VIRSWKNASTRRFAESGKGRWPGLDAERASLRLNQLDAAHALDDLGRLRSVGLHKLSGDRAGQWAVTINGRNYQQAGATGVPVRCRRRIRCRDR